MLLALPMKVFDTNVPSTLTCNVHPGGKGTRIYALNARYDRELRVINAI